MITAAEARNLGNKNLKAMHHRFFKRLDELVLKGVRSGTCRAEIVLSAEEWEDRFFLKDELHNLGYAVYFDLAITKDKIKDVLVLTW